uniref:Uncharacterized protein n=1 Tax=Cucumis melo TaxID=3656 RepID=A0A9I9E4Y2_CUCME
MVNSCNADINKGPKLFVGKVDPLMNAFGDILEQRSLQFPRGFEQQYPTNSKVEAETWNSKGDSTL